MFAATLATVLFALSSVSAKRSVQLLGSSHANLIRILLATLVLGTWAHLWGAGLGGPSLGWFLVSGLVGFGICDTAIFLALPRLGARLTSLMVQCLAAPVATIVEWAWLGTQLHIQQLLAGGVILTGVAVALMPERVDAQKTPSAPTLGWQGYGLGILAAAGQALGAVLSRHGQILARDVGQPIDGLSVAYQRILAGLAFTVIWWIWARRNRIGAPPSDPLPIRSALPWVVLNALSGPSLGVATYQWALQLQPTGIVMAIASLTPLVVIPLAVWIDGERPTPQSILGGLLAVVGAVVLSLL